MLQPAFARCNLLHHTAPTVALKGSVAGFAGYRHCRRPLDPGCWLLAAGWSWWVVANENGMELMEEIIMELMEEQQCYRPNHGATHAETAMCIDVHCCSLMFIEFSLMFFGVH